MSRFPEPTDFVTPRDKFEVDLLHRIRGLLASSPSGNLDEEQLRELLTSYEELAGRTSKGKLQVGEGDLFEIPKGKRAKGKGWPRKSKDAKTISEGVSSLIGELSESEWEAIELYRTGKGQDRLKADAILDRIPEDRRRKIKRYFTASGEMGFHQVMFDQRLTQEPLTDKLEARAKRSNEGVDAALEKKQRLKRLDDLVKRMSGKDLGEKDKTLLRQSGKGLARSAVTASLSGFEDLPQEELIARFEKDFRELESVLAVGDKWSAKGRLGTAAMSRILRDKRLDIFGQDLDRMVDGPLAATWADALDFRINKTMEEKGVLNENLRKKLAKRARQHLEKGELRAAGRAMDLASILPTSDAEAKKRGFDPKRWKESLKEYEQFVHNKFDHDMSPIREAKKRNLATAKELRELRETRRLDQVDPPVISERTGKRMRYREGETKKVLDQQAASESRAFKSREAEGRRIPQGTWSPENEGPRLAEPVGGKSTGRPDEFAPEVPDDERAAARLLRKRKLFMVEDAKKGELVGELQTLTAQRREAGRRLQAAKEIGNERAAKQWEESRKALKMRMDKIIKELEQRGKLESIISLEHDVRLGRNKRTRAELVDKIASIVKKEIKDGGTSPTQEVLKMAGFFAKRLR